MKQIVSSYGTWKSPLTAARVTAGALRFDHLVADGDDLYWCEGRASEGGRYVVVRRSPSGHIADVTPAEFNVRTRVHEYGGAAYTVHHGTVYFSNFQDQRLYRQAPQRSPEPITAEGFFYAEAAVDGFRNRLVCVREDHRSGNVSNAIVGVACDGTHEQVLASGADFYSDPVVTPDGARMAWLQWNHPNMPWDGTELWLAAFASDGSTMAPRKVAGGSDESIFQPSWSPNGELYFVSDRSGWWNLHRLRDGNAENLLPRAAEFGKPQWVFSQTTYCFIDERRIAATFTEHGRWRLGIFDIETRTFSDVETALEPIESIRAVDGALYFIGGSPTEAPCIVRMSGLKPGPAGRALKPGPAERALKPGPAERALKPGPAEALKPGPAGAPQPGPDAAERVQPPALHAEIIRSASTDRIPHAWISVAQPITFQSNDEAVHAFYYSPQNPDFVAPTGEQPPLIVISHGGPTAASLDVLDARIQFWTSRGFAILDVNYGGSTGFGRAYRDRLKAAWGIVDVRDCVNGALHLVREGQADAHRLAIRGGSAGGYTTLAALTFYDTFRAGASHYGVSDVEVLAADTHKFESRYLDSLIGPYPEARELYHARSPIHHTDKLSAALILFQGLDDKVVPPNQAEMMADAVRRKGLPVAYVAFEGEQHGFRKAENIIRSLEAELYFYGKVFGFTPADPIEPIEIANAP